MIKIGKFIEDVLADTQLNIECQVPFTLVEVDKNDKPVRILANSDGRRFRGFVRDDIRLMIDPGENMFTEIDARPIKPVHEVVSSVPVEVEPQEPLSLQDSIKQFCAQMIQHQYGRDSEEVDAFEEAFDYDIPDDDDFMPVGSSEVVMKDDPPPPPPDRDWETKLFN